MTSILSERDFGRLRWRCRRGLLENDLILERFFRRFGADLDQEQARDLLDLMEYEDRDLLDLLVGRAELPEPALTKGKVELLKQLRSRGG